MQTRYRFSFPEDVRQHYPGKQTWGSSAKTQIAALSWDAYAKTQIATDCDLSFHAKQAPFQFS